MSELSDEMFYKIQKLEIDLRGRFLRISAHAEALLIKNIILLNEEICAKTKIEKILNFRKLTFDEKIKTLPNYLQKNSSRSNSVVF